MFNASDRDPNPKEIPFYSRNPPKFDNPDNSEPFARIFEFCGIN